MLRSSSLMQLKHVVVPVLSTEATVSKLHRKKEQLLGDSIFCNLECKSLVSNIQL